MKFFKSSRNKSLESQELNKIQILQGAFIHSICYCKPCGQNDKDMVYSVKAKSWYCIECYENKLPKTFHDDWKPVYPFPKEKVFFIFYQWEQFLIKSFFRFYLSIFTL